jgi:hypothetical protein
MIFSENRCPPRIKSGAGFFGIMLYLLMIGSAAVVRECAGFLTQ